MKALAASAVGEFRSQIAVWAKKESRLAGMATEWSYVSGKQYSDPFNQVDVDAIVTLPSGQRRAHSRHSGRATPHGACAMLLPRPAALQDSI